MIASSRKVPLRTLPSFFSLAKKIKSSDFSCFLMPNSLSYGRISVLVSKSVATKASTRNKIKRQYYKLFSQHSTPKVGNDLVVRVHRQGGYTSLEQLYEQNKFVFDL